MRNNLFLLSNSVQPDQAYLEHARDALFEFLEDERRVLFVPYARVDYDNYTASVQQALAPLGIAVEGVHAAGDPYQSLVEARVVYVGGGNSFRLLKMLQSYQTLDIIRQRVQNGELRYMGVSAGSNMACPSLRTTNDMPIVQPTSFNALGLLPFQINPHYLDPDPNSTHMGETREMRIEEFLEENDVPVLGLREGSWLRRREDELVLDGIIGARLFMRNRQPCEIAPGTNLSWLLEVPSYFDRSLPMTQA